MAKDSLVKKLMMLAVTGAAVCYIADFLERHDIIDVRTLIGKCTGRVQETASRVKEQYKNVVTPDATTVEEGTDETPKEQETENTASVEETSEPEEQVSEEKEEPAEEPENTQAVMVSEEKEVVTTAVTTDDSSVQNLDGAVSEEAEDDDADPEDVSVVKL